MKIHGCVEIPDDVHRELVKKGAPCIAPDVVAVFMRLHTDFRLLVLARPGKGNSTGDHQMFQLPLELASDLNVNANDLYKVNDLHIADYIELSLVYISAHTISDYSRLEKGISSLLLNALRV